MPEFMPVLKSHLTSPHLLLRKAATAILLQLAHRQPEEVLSGKWRQREMGRRFVFPPYQLSTGPRQR